MNVPTAIALPGGNLRIDGALLTVVVGGPHNGPHITVASAPTITPRLLHNGMVGILEKYP
ncbi:hypothetical protein KI387_021741, partial [Taxus chinensis]